MEKPCLSKGKYKERGACMLSAECRSAVTQMPEGIKSNTEKVVTDTWTGSPWSGGVYMCVRKMEILKNLKTSFPQS